MLPARTFRMRLLADHLDNFSFDLGTVIVFLISRNISRNLYKVVNVLNQISDGNLNVETIRFDGKDEVAQLSGSINKTLLELKGIILRLKPLIRLVKAQR